MCLPDDFHMLQNIVFLFLFSQLFEDIKTILRSKVVQKQTVDWIWPVGCSAPTPALYCKFHELPCYVYHWDFTSHRGGHSDSVRGRDASESLPQCLRSLQSQPIIKYNIVAENMALGQRAWIHIPQLHS